MEKKEFKKMFNSIAQKHGFLQAFNGWFQESTECIIALELQKSNFANSYYLNIKIFVQGSFGLQYSKNAEILQKESDFFRRSPKEYEDALNLEIPMDNHLRNQKLESLFSKFLDPFAEKALSRNGIKELVREGNIALLPAVKKELGW